MNHRLVEQCVEHLCQKGCREVYAGIAEIEAGRAIPEAEGLSEIEKRAVIRELRSVMAVYQGESSCATG